MVDSKGRKSVSKGSVKSSGIDYKGDRLSASNSFAEVKASAKGKVDTIKSAAKSAAEVAAKVAKTSFCVLKFSCSPLESDSPTKEDQKGMFISFMSTFFPGTFAKRYYDIKLNKGTEESGIRLSPSNLYNHENVILEVPSYKFSYKDFERFLNWKKDGSKSNSLYYDDKFKGFMSLVSLDNKLTKDYGSGVSIKREGLRYEVVIEIDVTNRSREELEEIIGIIAVEFLDIRDSQIIKTTADRLYRGIDLDSSDFKRDIADKSESNGWSESVDKKEENTQSRANGKESIASKNSTTDHGEENIDTKIKTVIGGAESNGSESVDKKEENTQSRANDKESIASKNSTTDHGEENIDIKLKINTELEAELEKEGGRLTKNMVTSNKSEVTSNPRSAVMRLANKENNADKIIRSR